MPSSKGQGLRNRMIDLVQRLRQTEVGAGELGVCFLGQAGFVYKTERQQYIVVDPYLTDCCESRYGTEFKRMSPPVIDPEELAALPLSAYLLTHHHIDHLDPECVRRLCDRDDSFPFFAPPKAISILVELGVDVGRCRELSDGSVHEHGGAVIHGVFADHGEAAPDAVGIVVRSGGRTVYHMGDTALREAPFARIAEQFQTDLLIAPINGMFGNMSDEEAAAAVSVIRPKRAVPCHYWMLPGNSGGNPYRFVEQARRLAPETEAFLLAQGEIVVI